MTTKSEPATKTKRTRKPKSSVMDQMGAYQRGVNDGKKLLDDGLDRESFMVSVRVTIEQAKNPTAEEKAYARGMEDAAKAPVVAPKAPDHLPVPDSLLEPATAYQGYATVARAEGIPPIDAPTVPGGPKYNPREACDSGYEKQEVADGYVPPDA